MSLGVPTLAATPVGRFRIVASGRASPIYSFCSSRCLKYGFGIDVAVTIVGMAHGVLFLAYCATLAVAARRLGTRRTVIALAMSLVPGGTFWLEARLRDDQRELARRAA